MMQSLLRKRMLRRQRRLKRLLRKRKKQNRKSRQTVTMKVNASSLNVRSEANTTSSVVTSLTNGDTVEVLGDASQEWVQIRCTSKNNEEGYVKSEYLVAAE